jgi:hypothetical protein
MFVDGGEYFIHLQLDFRHHHKAMLLP